MDAAAGAVGGRGDEPRWPPRIPQSRIDHARIGRVDDDLDRADVLILVEDFLPGAAAVARAVQTAVRVRGVEVANRSHEDHVGVPGIDSDLADVLRVAQAEVRPRVAGVGRLVDAVTEAHRVAQGGLAAADVDHVGRRWRDRQRTDRRDGLVVEYREPGSAGVDGFPDAAVHVAEVELVGPAGHARRGVAAAASERAEHAPVLRVGGWGLGAGGPRAKDWWILREPECRERDAGLGDVDEEIAARGHDYGVTLAKYTSRFVG